MPESLYTEAMKVLAKLQQPLPETAPRCMRSDAWAELQLWTQLGAWAEQRHTWALHAKLAVYTLGSHDLPTGMVAPYPDFFSGLATIARSTANAFEQLQPYKQFEARTIAADLLEAIDAMENQMRVFNEEDVLEGVSEKYLHFSRFLDRYVQKYHAQAAKKEPYPSLINSLRELGQRCLKSNDPSPTDLEILRLFYDCKEDITQLLNEFATVCDRLSILAAKTRDNIPLTTDDAKWIESYGVTLARMHFYYDHSFLYPRDDFPIVTRVYANRLLDSSLYVGVARPQALYVIAETKDGLQLYRGAVLTYREFIRPTSVEIDDTVWRNMIAEGRTPPAPTFTHKFYTEMSLAELLRRGERLSKADEPDDDELEETLTQLELRVSNDTVPQLLKLLTTAKSDELREGLAEIIAKLNWRPYQQRLIQLLGSEDHSLAEVALDILTAQPALIDEDMLISAYKDPRASATKRRLCCEVVSRLPHLSTHAREMLLHALRDPDATVRQQAAKAITESGWNDAQSQAALLSALDDTNQFVAIAAIDALAKLKATNTAPALFAKLNALLDSQPAPPDAATHPKEVRAPPDLWFSPASQSGNLLVINLIKALGELSYEPAADKLFQLETNTTYRAAAILALMKIAPDRLVNHLVSIAMDTKRDSYERDRALVTLGRVKATNCVNRLLPLLDDSTPIVYDPPASKLFPGWQIHYRAAITIASLLKWRSQLSFPPGDTNKHEQLIERIREWAKTQPSDNHAQPAP